MTAEETPELSDEASPTDTNDPSAPGILVPGRITLFGFDDVPTSARIEARSTGWRARRASVALAAGLIVAPAVGLVPPHAPWALGALGMGLLTAVRRWAEKHTLHFLDGACPRCGGGVTLSRPVRLRHPHPIACPSCQYESALSVDL